MAVMDSNSQLEMGDLYWHAPETHNNVGLLDWIVKPLFPDDGPVYPMYFQKQAPGILTIK